MGYYLDESSFKAYMWLFALVSTCALVGVAIYAGGIYHKLSDLLCALKGCSLRSQFFASQKTQRP